LLGTIGIVSSPMLLIQGVRSGFDLSTPDRVDAALGLVFLVGWACSVVALRVLRATGTGRTGAVVLAVQAAGLSLAASQQVQDFMLQEQKPENTLYQIANLAWPVSVLLMLVAGGLTASAGRFTGWRRWAPSLCGLALPLLLAAIAVGRRQIGMILFGVYTTLAWALLGLAVRTTPNSISVTTGLEGRSDPSD